MLPFTMSIVAAQCLDRSNNHRENLVRLAHSIAQVGFRYNTASFQQLHPIDRLVTFLFDYFQLRDHIGSRSATTCRAIVRTNRRSRAQQLPADDISRSSFRKRFNQADNLESKSE